MRTMALENSVQTEDWMQVVLSHPGVERIGAGEGAMAEGGAAQSPWVDQLLAAVQTPLEGVSLKDSVYPGDTVAICVGPGVPGAAVIVPALVEWLLEHGVAATDMVVVDIPATASSGETEYRAVRGEASESTLSIKQLHHQADDQKALAMVGVSRGNQPIYVNAQVAEADVVIPVVVMERDAAQTLAGSIYPGLSSAETQERLRGHDAELNQESLDAENLVCPFLMLGVIPAPGGDRGEVVAGVRSSLQAYAERRLAALWTTPAAEHAAVIATLEGYHEQGLWERLRRGLENAARVASPAAPIIMVLVHPGLVTPFAPVGSARKKNSERRRLMELVEETSRQRPVFLASTMAENQVETLGFGCIATAAELERLLARNSAVGLLRDADRWRIEE
jgi:hypothetical protein